MLIGLWIITRFFKKKVNVNWNLRSAYHGHPAETIGVLKVTTLLLLRYLFKAELFRKSG